MAPSPGQQPPPGKLETPPVASEHERATAAVQRWASEFRAQKRRP
ncbi:hypothetical protein [Corallococcus exiguus]|nr:hypothetical protein [Corallococcus exiguus]